LYNVLHFKNAHTRVTRQRAVFPMVFNVFMVGELNGAFVDTISDFWIR
jgi:hypothetical protein